MTSETRLDVKQLLRIRELPSLVNISRDNEKSLEACCAIYDCKPEDVASCILDQGFSYAHVLRFTARFMNRTASRFYLKNNVFDVNGRSMLNDERFNLNYVEALGMALSNLVLGKEHYRFAADEQLAAAEEIPGCRFDYLGDEDLEEGKNSEFDENSSFNYGFALVQSEFLGLGDRCELNVLLTPNGEVVNIDFESLFAYNAAREEIGRHRPEPKFYRYIDTGKEKAKEIIQKNLAKNFPAAKAMIDFVYSKNPRRRDYALLHIKGYL